MAASRFEDSRSGDCLRRHLGSCRGFLQVNGDGACNKPRSAKDGGNDGPGMAGCRGAWPATVP